MTEDRGRLMDCATIARELGVSRKVAEKIMRQLPKVTFPNVKKTYVQRTDVERLMAEGTVDSTARTPLRVVHVGRRVA